MTNQSTDKVMSANSSDSGNDDEPSDYLYFKWTLKREKKLLETMQGLKPFGINKHLNILLIHERLSEYYKQDISTKSIWKYLEKKWNCRYADKVEQVIDNNDTEEDFDLPEEYDQLYAEEIEKIKTQQEKESLNNENNKRTFSDPSKTRSKSNSMSSVDSKDGINDSILSESTSVRSSENGYEEISSFRRSLRTNDKFEDKELEEELANKKKIIPINNKFDELNKTKDLKLLNKKISISSKDLEKNDIVFNGRGRKRKIRNVSESSSDNNKQLRGSKNNCIDNNVSDSSSRSVTPEILKGKTSTQTITPETITRKSNLRSNDKDQKNKTPIEKDEKQFTHLMEIKSKQSIQNKSDAINKTKIKTRGRVTSDFLVAQQSPVVQPLGRRSCSNKNL